MDEFAARFSQGWISIWDERPSKLFDGVDQQLSIHIYRNRGTLAAVHITTMAHWTAEERRQIFQHVRYTSVSTADIYAGVLPKIGSATEGSLLSRLYKSPRKLIGEFIAHTDGARIYYRNAGGRYWRLVKSFPSYFKSSAGASRSSTEKMFTVDAEFVKPLVAVLSSSLFYWFWRVVSNCRHLTDRELFAFSIPLSLLYDNNLSTIQRFADKYETRLNATKQRLVTQNKQTGELVQEVYYASTAKDIIDEIDCVLAKHYGFTDEELDFIINYDIKYRMGLGGDEEEGE
jgi:hypothetical protein